MRIIIESININKFTMWELHKIIKSICNLLCNDVIEENITVTIEDDKK
jgi:hypothetical protein